MRPNDTDTETSDEGPRLILENGVFSQGEPIHAEFPLGSFTRAGEWVVFLTPDGEPRLVLTTDELIALCKGNLDATESAATERHQPSHTQADGESNRGTNHGG